MSIMLHRSGVMGSASQGASYQVTTTGADQTHTLGALTVSAETHIDWGDGSSNDYTGAGARTHVYATADTYQVTIQQPANVTALTLAENTITVNSADLKRLVNVTTFRAYFCKDGRWDSADVSDWRPALFYLFSMPSGYAGTFDSADVSDWRPSFFDLHTMPSGYAGTFDSADVSDWRPTLFYLFSMPSGYAGTFDSADVSDWRPTNFLLYSMPTATFSITITASSFQYWTTGLANFYMQENALLEAQVDLILWELYQAAATRTATGGTLYVGGSNANPSGTFQAASAPVTSATDGWEVMHELQNDGQAVGFNVWTTVSPTS